MTAKLVLPTSGTSNGEVSLAAKVTLLSCAVFTLLTGASISPALPAINAHFATDPNSELLSKLVLTVSPLFIAVSGPVWGWIVDRVGRKPVLLAGIVGTAAFGVIASFMNSLIGLIVCRALLGIAVSGVTSACYTLMIDYFDGEERNRFMGLQTAVQKIGGLTFLVLGGLLAAVSWRATFAIDAIALFVLPGVLLAIREPQRRADGAVRTPAISAQSLNWLVVTAVWIVAFGAQLFFYTLPTQLPFMLTERVAASPQLVGMSLAVSTLFSAGTATIYHRLKARLSHSAIFAGASILVAVSFVWLSAITSMPMTIAALAIGGAGFGLFLPNVMVWLARDTPVHLRGRAVGIMMTGNFLGQFASPLFAQPIIARSGIDGLFLLMGIAAAVFAMVFAISAALARSRQQ